MRFARLVMKQVYPCQSAKCPATKRQGKKRPLWDAPLVHFCPVFIESPDEKSHKGENGIKKGHGSVSAVIIAALRVGDPIITGGFSVLHPSLSLCTAIQSGLIQGKMILRYFKRPGDLMLKRRRTPVEIKHTEPHLCSTELRLP